MRRPGDRRPGANDAGVSTALPLTSSEQRLLEQTLQKPLMAHIACDGGETLSNTPVWFLWDGTTVFAIATQASGFVQRLERDHRAALSIVDFDLADGRLVHVGMRGRVTLNPMDDALRQRLVARYLGSPINWDASFDKDVVEKQNVLLAFTPGSTVVRDQSYFKSDQRASPLAPAPLAPSSHSPTPDSRNITITESQIITPDEIVEMSSVRGVRIKPTPDGAAFAVAALCAGALGIGSFASHHPLMGAFAFIIGCLSVWLAYARTQYSVRITTDRGVRYLPAANGSQARDLARRISDKIRLTG